jgi:ubiquinone/menaquinone biosynthesis C-methylase UbiE
MHSNNIKNFYETDSGAYDLRWEKKGGRITAESQMKIVNNFIKTWQEYNVLEVGCGSGRFSTCIAKKVSSVIYIDLTLEMLKVTRKKLEHNDYQFNGINASGYKIPLATGSKDAVISINVFNHIEEPLQIISEIHRVLRQGGKLLLNFTNIYSYYFPLALYVNHMHTSIGRDVYSVWSKPSDVTSLLSSIGFSLVEIVGHVFVPKHLDRPIIREIPILLDKVARNNPLKWISPTLFFYCEKA